jgi:arylsulfatase A-like enzyme
LWVHYFDPHYPYVPPAGYDHLLGLDYHGTIDGSVDTIHAIENGQLRPKPADLARLEELYQGEVAFADAQLGKLLGHLGQVGVADDTIVVVTGDHGESFGEHGDCTHGLKVFETEIRVPLLLHYRAGLPAGTVLTAPVQLIDVMPTLLGLTGLSAKQSIQGTSFLPLIDGTGNGETRAAFTELADESFVSVLTYGDWKLIRNDANGQLQLYNLNADEAEQRNLTTEQPQMTRELASRLNDLMQISGVSK